MRQWIIEIFSYALVIVLVCLSTLSDLSVEGEVIPQHIGCYKDNRDDLKLTGYGKHAANITSSQCTVYCFNKAFLYAAIKNGKECSCGDFKGDLPEADDDSACDKECKDKTDKCGGRQAYSLYSTGIKEEEIEDIDELEIGCLEEKDETRLIREHKVDLLKTNSPSRCIAYCRALGYPHAGLQYATECYCGLARRLNPIVFGCNMPCSGNPKQKCGGRWRSMIYSTGITKPQPSIKPKGCYQFSKLKFDEKMSLSMMDHNKCISHCFAKKFQFAHLWNGRECLCGNALVATKYRGAIEQCDIDCPGKNEDKCGGEMHVITFSTGISGEPSLGKMVGCYNNEKEDLLKGPKLNLGNENSITTCLAKCIELGYAFAALRNTYECQCSQISPKRVPVRVVPDGDCAHPCPNLDYQLDSCGAPLFSALYRTGLAPSSEEDCSPSVTNSNGKSTCSGQVLFLEDFNHLDLNKWKHTVRISGEDAEFVAYTSKRKNLDTLDGKLIIKPTILTDKFIKYGHLHLKGCTGLKNSLECSSQAKWHQIIPPVETGQICTKDIFSFRFGNVSVRAKMPKGDWVIPQIWLKPAKEVYGPGYISGKIIVAAVRGNADLVTPQGKDIGAKLVESGFQLAMDNNGPISSKTSSIVATAPLYTDFINYNINWTPDKMLFYVNGKLVSSLKSTFAYTDRSLVEDMGLEKNKYWSSGSVLAPFDEEFYLCVGLSVGGIRHFPDLSTSNGFMKPWRDNHVKARLNFWLNRSSWERTWSNDTKFEIDFIRVTAL